MRPRKIQNPKSKIQNSTDFQVLNEPPPSYWRTRASRPAKGFARYGLALLSLLTLALALWPHTNGYREALSFQIARGEITTWLLFASMTLVLLYTSFRLFKSERPFSAIFCLLTIGGLIMIAKTDPYSTNHLSIFVMLLLISLSWECGVAMQTALETGSE